MGSDAQCTTIEQHDGGDESNSSFLGQTNLYSIISYNIQVLNTKKQKHKVQLIYELANNENTFTFTLTETHLNEKILDSEVQMKNYIRFRADRTLGRKNWGEELTYFKATESVDAEQLIAKSKSYVEYQLIHIKTEILFLLCTFFQTVQQKNLAAP